MKNLRCFVFGVILLGVVISVTAQPSASQSAPAEKATQAAKDAPEISLKSYQEILDSERKLLEEQSEKYYNRVDKLIERATWFFGIVVAVVSGLLGWTFLKTRKEVKDSLKAKLEEAGVKQMQKELMLVRDEYQVLKQELDSMTAYQRRHIKWLYAAGCTLPDRSRLAAIGLQNIASVPIQKNDAVNLADADLVIISHEGDKEDLGKNLFNRVLDEFIKDRLQTPLVVYTLRNYKLNNDEFGKLSQVELAVPANTQATLVGYVQSLLRVGKVQKAL
jgi:hypothetical protein